jgi:hypothetical protein
MAHLDTDSIKIDDGVDFIQWSVLPEQNFFFDCIGNLGNQGWRFVNAVPE